MHPGTCEVLWELLSNDMDYDESNGNKEIRKMGVMRRQETMDRAKKHK